MNGLPLAGFGIMSIYNIDTVSKGYDQIVKFDILILA